MRQARRDLQPLLVPSLHIVVSCTNVVYSKWVGTMCVETRVEVSNSVPPSVSRTPVIFVRAQTLVLAFAILHPQTYKLHILYFGVIIKNFIPYNYSPKYTPHAGNNYKGNCSCGHIRKFINELSYIINGCHN